jgi:hypothetical protein
VRMRRIVGTVVGIVGLGLASGLALAGPATAETHHAMKPLSRVFSGETFGSEPECAIGGRDAMRHDPAILDYACTQDGVWYLWFDYP